MYDIIQISKTAHEAVEEGGSGYTPRRGHKTCTMKNKKIEVKKMGSAFVSIEKIFTTLKDAIAYAEAHNKKTVWKKGRSTYVV